MSTACWGVHPGPTKLRTNESPIVSAKLSASGVSGWAAAKVAVDQRVVGEAALHQREPPVASGSAISICGRRLLARRERLAKRRRRQRLDLQGDGVLWLVASLTGETFGSGRKEAPQSVTTRRLLWTSSERVDRRSAHARFRQ